jgi:hypothetical protein
MSLLVTTCVKTENAEKKEKKPEKKSVWIIYQFTKDGKEPLKSEDMKLKRQEIDGLQMYSVTLSFDSDWKENSKNYQTFSNLNTDLKKQQELFEILNQVDIVYLYHATQFYGVLKNFFESENAEQSVLNWRFKSRSLLEYLVCKKSIKGKPTFKNMIEASQEKVFQKEFYIARPITDYLLALKILTVHSSKICYNDHLNKSHYSKVVWPLYEVYSVKS